MTNAPTNNLEIEIKLRLGSFMDYLKLVGRLSPIDEETQHINGFFDTEDRRLAKGGWALRVRAESHRGLVTIKSIPTEAGMAVVRREIESESIDVILFHPVTNGVDNESAGHRARGMEVVAASR